MNQNSLRDQESPMYKNPSNISDNNGGNRNRNSGGMSGFEKVALIILLVLLGMGFVGRIIMFFNSSGKKEPETTAIDKIKEDMTNVATEDFIKPAEKSMPSPGGSEDDENYFEASHEIINEKLDDISLTRDGQPDFEGIVYGISDYSFYVPKEFGDEPTRGSGTASFYAETGANVSCITITVEDNTFTDAEYNNLDPSWTETEKSFKEIYTNMGFENVNVSNRKNLEIADYHGCSLDITFESEGQHVNGKAYIFIDIDKHKSILYMLQQTDGVSKDYMPDFEFAAERTYKR